jgi:DNA polymerase I-like protein with 3'-5' exonuclease and polymerase domains
MDSVARRYLGITTIHYEDVAGKGAKQLTFSQVPVEQAASTPPRTPTSRCAAPHAVAARSSTSRC